MVLDAVWRVVLSAIAATSRLWLDEVLSTVRPSRVVFALVIQLSCIQCFTNFLSDAQDIRVLHFAITPLLLTMLVTPNVRAALHDSPQRQRDATLIPPFRAKESVHVHLKCSTIRNIRRHDVLDSPTIPTTLTKT